MTSPAAFTAPGRPSVPHARPAQGPQHRAGQVVLLTTLPVHGRFRKSQASSWLTGNILRDTRYDTEWGTVKTAAEKDRQVSIELGLSASLSEPRAMKTSLLNMPWTRNSFRAGAGGFRFLSSWIPLLFLRQGQSLPPVTQPQPEKPLTPPSVLRKQPKSILFPHNPMFQGSGPQAWMKIGQRYLREEIL